MMIADVFTYNKSKYFVFISILILINTFLHPLTAGYIPRNNDGTLNYAQAFLTNFVTWAISFNIFGLIIGGGIAAFKKKKNEPIQVRTAKSVISTIFYIQLICATIHIMLLIGELIDYFVR